MTLQILNQAQSNAGAIRRILNEALPGLTKIECEPIDGHVLPIVIIKGLSAGPTVCISAGVHGSEYCAIEAAQRLLTISPTAVVGTLVILPLVNGGAFKNRSVYLNPADGKNLNRVFPGNAQGTASEKIAAWLVEEVLRGMDALVDLHCGDLSESLTPFTIFCDGDDRSKSLALSFGLPYAIASQATGMMIAGALSVGVPAIIAEAGGAGKYDETAIRALVDGLHRLLKATGSLDGRSSSQMPDRPVQVLCCESVVAKESGLWYPSYSVGDAVEAKIKLGTVRNPYGEEIGAPISPVGGKIMFQISSLAVNGGETIAWIGTQ
ncbi:succinylglutamate desuccinylase/aspartoacylase family protein [Rhizobium rhizogenes]|uniref:succinylglutamate desuccinylase/aspartoacylase family protein n=1 Tax=Rhizobium rhizogenes TaxID=359 RepID=UPI00226DEC7B|nr:succinylglutamate desuccinylase/aspartoacylase family protein [Rhizobium rhizogenes]